jgi:hypothetical protein
MTALPLVKIEVPVKDVESHMVCCIEQGFEWFRWLKVSEGKEGYDSAEVMLFDDSFRARKDGQNREGLKEELPTLPDDAVILRWQDGYPVFRFNTEDFVRGLGACMAKGLGRSMVASIRYDGNGDWDIDSGGADCVVQMALLGDIVFG